MLVLAVRMTWEKLFVFVIVWMHAEVANSSRDCNYSILFPGMKDGRTVTAPQDTDVVVRFRLESACGFYENLRLRVFKEKSKTTEGAACVIWPGKEHYVSRLSSCSHVINGLYELRRTVQMRDSGLWIWQTNTEPPYETNVFFNITGSVINSTKRPHSSSVNETATQTEARNPGFTSQPSQPTQGFFQTGTMVPVTTVDTTEPSASLLDLNLTIVITVTIAAVAATLITFRVVSVRKAGTTNENPPEPRIHAAHDDGRQDPQDTSAYHYYWKIQDDDLSASSGAPAFSCRAPATLPDVPKPDADGYMTPVPSRAVINNTDGARNVIPMYHNSRCAVQKGASASVMTAPDPATEGTQYDTDGYLIPVKAVDEMNKRH